MITSAIDRRQATERLTIQLRDAGDDASAAVSAILAGIDHTIHHVFQTVDGMVSVDIAADQLDDAITTLTDASKLVASAQRDDQFETADLKVQAKPAAPADQTSPVDPAGADAQAVPVPNDPRYSEVWALDHVGTRDAWEVTRGTRDMVVAVLDTGVDITHPDLADAIWTNPGEIPGDGIDNDQNGYIDDVNGWNLVDRSGNVSDGHSHGTHVAGTIAAQAGNGIGVSGIAPGVSIMPVKVLSDSGSGSSIGVAAGIDYAVAAGAQILNLSLGSPSPSGVIQSAIEAARAAGVLVVAAAGNDNYNEAGYPAGHTEDNIISVAASTQSDIIAGFSNYSATRTSVDLAAPGTSILSTVPGGGYAYYQGTSMASPLVAGAAGLVWSANPGWTYGHVINALYDSVDPLPDQSKSVVTDGRLNVAAAIGSDPDPTPPDTPPPPPDDFGDDRGSAGGGTRFMSIDGALGSPTDVDWIARPLDAGITYTFDLRGQSSGSGTLQDPVLSLYSAEGALIARNDDGGIGFDSSITFSAQDDGRYYLVVEGYAGSTGTWRLNVSERDDGPDDDLGNGPADAGGGSRFSLFTGTLETDGDVDWVARPLDAGVTYTFDLKGSATGDGTLSDPVLALHDPSGREITRNDDGGAGLNSRITFTAQTDGRYFLVASGFAGATGTWALEVAEREPEPEEPPEDDIGNTRSTAARPGRFSTFRGNLEYRGDADWVARPLEGGVFYRIDLLGSWTGNGTLSDPLLTVYDSAGRRVRADDDGGTGLNSRVVLTPEADGTYFIVAEGYGNATGTWTMRVTGDETPEPAPPERVDDPPPDNESPPGTPAVPPDDGDDSPPSAPSPPGRDGGSGSVPEAPEDTPDPATPPEARPAPPVVDDGSRADDVINGASGDDQLEGGDGDDVLNGGAGADMLDGGAGADWAFYTGSPTGVTVRLWAEAGEGGDAEGDVLRRIENLRASPHDDVVSGSDAANILEGEDGNDRLYGRDGDDIVRGSYGDDIVDGGAGNDAAVGGPGNDTVLGGDGDDALRGNSQNDLVDGQGGSDRVFGNIGGDRVRGGSGDDFLWGLTGNDRLYGGAGADELFGGWGGDILQGGDGRDLLVGDGGADIFQFTAGGGTDTIRDFQATGSEHDVLDVHRLLDAVGYAGATPVADGIVRIVEDGGDARVEVQSATGDFATVAVVADLDHTTLDHDRYFVTDDTYWFG